MHRAAWQVGNVVVHWTVKTHSLLLVHSEMTIFYYTLVTNVADDQLIRSRLHRRQHRACIRRKRDGGKLLGRSIDNITPTHEATPEKWQQEGSIDIAVHDRGRHGRPAASYLVITNDYVHVSPSIDLYAPCKWHARIKHMKIIHHNISMVDESCI